MFSLDNPKMLVKRNKYILFTSFGQYFHLPVILYRSINPSISLCLQNYSDKMSQYFPREVLRPFITTRPGIHQTPQTLHYPPPPPKMFRNTPLNKGNFKNCPSVGKKTTQAIPQFPQYVPLAPSDSITSLLTSGRKITSGGLRDILRKLRHKRIQLLQP